MATYQVSANSDDVQRGLSGDTWEMAEPNSVGYAISGYLQYGCGMRFQSVLIPQGATIDTAKLTLQARFSNANTTVNSRISAEDVDDAPTFADDKAAFDTRYGNHTTEVVDWDNIGAWTADADYDSPDISAVIKEIVDRPGWVSGQDIVIFWEDFDDRSTHSNGRLREAEQHEHDAANAPKLVITHTPAAVDYPISTSTGLTASASIDRDVAWDRGTSPGLVISATVARALAYDRGMSPGLTAAVTIVKGWGRAIASSCGLTVSATVARTVAWDRGTNPGLTLAVTLARALAYDRATSSGLTVAVTILKGWGRAIATACGLTTSATIDREVAYDRGMSPGLTTSITVDREVAYDRGTSSGLTASATIDREVTYTRATSPGLTAAVTILKGWGRTITTSTALSVAISIVKTLTLSHSGYNVEVDWNADGDFGDADENITSDVKSVTYKRGKDEELGKASPGSLEVRVNDE